MKEIFFLLLIILIGFSGEIRHVKCPPGKVEVCGCFNCFCKIGPKCSNEEVARCSSRPPYPCFCYKKVNNSK